MIDLPKNYSEQLKYQPGIYCLFKGKKLQYIGQSADIARRIEEHLDAKKIFDRIWAIKIGFSSVLDDIDTFTNVDLENNIELREILEIGLIHSLQPRLNTLKLSRGSFTEWLNLLPSTTFYKKNGANQEQIILRVAKLQSMIFRFQTETSLRFQFHKGIVLQ